MTPLRLAPLLLLAACGEPLLPGAADACLVTVDDAGERVARCDANLLRDDDVAALEGVVAVTGDLRILGPRVTGLSPLASLRRVGGALRVGAPAHGEPGPRLDDLSGLDALEVVEGDLTVNVNRRLARLDGLGGLRRVGGSVHVGNNPRLTDLDGLAGLTSIGGDLSVVQGPALRSVAGLGSLTTLGSPDLDPCDGGAGGDLHLGELPSLTSLDGLEGVAVAREVYVGGVEALTSVAGLGGLTAAARLDLHAPAADPDQVDALLEQVAVCD